MIPPSTTYYDGVCSLDEETREGRVQWECAVYIIYRICVCVYAMRSQPHAPVETVDVDRKYVGTRTILLCGFLAVPVPPDLTRVPTTVRYMPLCLTCFIVM